MSRPAGFSATGTARLHYLQSRGLPAAEDPLETFLLRVAAGAREHDLGDESLYLARELVQRSWHLSGEEREAEALLVLASMIAASNGSTRIPTATTSTGYLGGVIAAIARAGGLELDRQAVLKRIRRLLSEGSTFSGIIGSPGSYAPLISDGHYLYQHRLLWCEDELARRLRALLARPLAMAGDVERALEEVVARPAHRNGMPLALSPEQVSAVRRAASAPLTVISGGPGTGKTSVVVSILRTLCRLGLQPAAIALAAPTGKAANRLSEAIREPLATLIDPHPCDTKLLELPAAQTLHRLLGYSASSDRFFHHDNNPLAGELLIVDEASMIDLGLAERLLRAVPATMRVILLGDAEQLPSVDAGAVLRELIAGLGDAAIRLTKSFRMDPADPSGRSVLAAARAVNLGRAQPILEAQRDRLEHLEYRGIEYVENTPPLEVVEHWYRTRIAEHPDLASLAAHEYRHHHGGWAADDEAALRRLLAIYQRSRILTVTRRFATGSVAINRILHQELLSGTGLSLQTEFYPGEPVLIRQNDYARGLFNGDQGVIARVRDDDGRQSFRAVFGRGGELVPFPIDALRQHLELAFAMTVHKSQGSELDQVTILLPTTDLPLLTREMLYTAITRARRSAVVVGSRSLLERAVQRPVERFSGLAEKLRR